MTTQIPTLILEYRQLSKLVSAPTSKPSPTIYTQITKRIHASFNQTVAATGRLSSSDPNLQNIPNPLRDRTRNPQGFHRPRRSSCSSPQTIPRSSSASSRTLSDDPALIAAFLAGEDIHQAVASQINNIPLADVTKEQRSGAKMVNFGIVYGVTPWGLARRLNVSNSEASEIIDNYKAKFANITTFLEECVTFARSHGYVETMLGRRRPINDIDDRNPQRKALSRAYGDQLGRPRVCRRPHQARHDRHPPTHRDCR